MKRACIFLFFLIIAAVISKNEVHGETVVKEWDVFEIEMTAESTFDNPYVGGLPDNGTPLVRATFKCTDGAGKGETYTVSGFWDGSNSWKARFAPPAAGNWTYTTESRDKGLDGRKGSFTCTGWTDAEKIANPARNGVIRVSKSGNRPGRHFEYDNGTPFLWIADTWWNWTKRGAYLSSFQKIVDDRAEKGFTIGQLFVAGNGWGRASSLLDETYNILDIEHMRKVDSMIEYANSKGLTVWVHAWWSRENIDESIGAEKMERWWQYLVHRLGAYNVIWIIAGEYNMYDYGGLGLDFWKDLGRMIKDEDPYKRIIGAHPTPPSWSGGADAPQWSTSAVIHNELWLDYNQSQPGHGKWRNELIPQIVSSDYAKIPAKPIVVTEPWYEFILDDPAGVDIRFGAWSAVLSGAAGHSYAGGHVWKAHVPEAPGGKDTWPMELGFETNTLDYPGAVSMGHMAKFLKGIRWWELAPHPELVLEYSEKYCAAVPGEEYVVYLRWGGAPKIDLNPSSPDDTFEFTWYDPRTGELRDPGTISGGGVRYFRAPEGYPANPHYKDWVLYIKKMD
ncbi:DUF4038 domain-containing protein [Candidatus Latescibacterota bacterium]